jgi:hypothetical protein
MHDPNLPSDYRAGGCEEWLMRASHLVQRGTAVRVPPGYGGESHTLGGENLLLFRDQKRPRILYVIIFAIIFGTAVFGIMTDSDPHNQKPDRRPHRVTRVLRNYDPAFEDIADTPIARASRIVCSQLKQGQPVDIILTELPGDIPADKSGELIQTAVSTRCPHFRAVVREFVLRQS